MAFGRAEPTTYIGGGVGSARITSSSDRFTQHESVAFTTRVSRQQGLRTRHYIHLQTSALVPSPFLEEECALYRVHKVTLSEVRDQKSPENRLMGVVL